MQPPSGSGRPTHGGPSLRAEDQDAADAARVLAGDVDAFAGIVQRWQGPLVNLAFRFCRDRSRAEDMAQEAFLRAYRSLASFRGESAFSTWLIALAVNLFRSRLRRHEPAVVGLDAVARLSGLPALELDLERSDRARLVRTAVAGLPARYRDALLLFYFVDLDVAEAASALGVAVGTVKARLHRGRALLRRRVAGRLSSGAPGAACAEEA
jgi:RNA polymerase sigma-70 factor (ECF subfamily)